MKLSIVVPAHNEQENIKESIDKIELTVDIPHELVIVNDHSSDETAAIVGSLVPRYANVRLVENKLDGGFANALRTGFKHATGEVVVPVMADLCDDLQTIKPMFDKINEGYDVVCGCRYIKGGERIGGSGFKGFLSGAAGWTLNLLLGVPTHDIANAFKMYRRRVLEGMAIESQGFEISMEIPLKAYFCGFKISEVPTKWKEREKGKSNFKIFKLLPSYIRLYVWAFLKRLRLI